MFRLIASYSVQLPESLIEELLISGHMVHALSSGSYTKLKATPRDHSLFANVNRNSFQLDISHKINIKFQKKRLRN